MKVKPKEIFVNLPVVLMFDNSEKIPEFASNVNTILHGKVRLKYEDLGVLGGQYVGLFYLQRNDEYHTLREEFINMINLEEIGTTVTDVEEELEQVDSEELDDVTRPVDPEAKPCIDCGGFHSGACQ